jgi:hypothetical protein
MSDSGVHLPLSLQRTAWAAAELCNEKQQGKCVTDMTERMCNFVKQMTLTHGKPAMQCFVVPSD